MEATQQKQPLDMLNGPIWNKLPRYALPVAATAVLEQLFNASDLAVVGNFTGEFRTAAVAAVGANSPVIGLIINLFVGIALGANVVIANAIGQQDSRTVHRTVHTAVLMSIIGGILVALLGQLAAGPLLGALNVPEDVLPFALRYLRIHADCMGRILRIGLPAGIQSAVFSVSNIVIQAGINSLGTVVMAASSAALNLELMAYFVLNSFSQACTTFVGQNYGAWKLDRCKKTLALSLLEDAIATAAVIALVLGAGKPVLAIFNNDPQVISLGYTRLVLVFSAYMFSMMYEVMSGYLRGFGISLTPAALTTLGVCGIRIFWIAVVFPRNPTFRTIMYVYPISLSTTALLIFLALLWFRPAKRAAEQG